jgi:glycosyltransferase involved in cell wall biosynthesis
MKLLVLYTRLSGYMTACLQAFRDAANAELLIFAWPKQKDAPFADKTFAALGAVRLLTTGSVDEIAMASWDFQPDAVLVSGWQDPRYIKICRRLKRQGIPIISGCDTQWTGAVRQKVAAAVSRFYLHRFIDVLWVSGERQRALAWALGYRGDRCWDGYYACDWSAFARPDAPAISAFDRPGLLYVGRYASEKGLDTLAEAYRLYRREVLSPWPLVCAGAGPLREALVSAGAEDRGFVQPRELPSLMYEASAFVLPSRFEPWGVVAQEAAASTLPLILSDACGAAAHLLRPYYNGFIFEAGSVKGLLRALKAMHALEPERHRSYAQASYELSKQYTPQRWAETLIEGLSTWQTR